MTSESQKKTGNQSGTGGTSRTKRMGRSKKEEEKTFLGQATIDWLVDGSVRKLMMVMITVSG